MSTNRTTPWTRQELLDEAKRVHAGALSVIGHAHAMQRGRHELVYEAEALGAIVAVLENYPLAKFAEIAVNVVISDLSMRKGFDDLILRDDFRPVRNYLVTILEKLVDGPKNPFPNKFDRMVDAKAPSELEAALDFDVPEVPATAPAADLDFE